MEMKSLVVKRSIVVAGHKTSVSLEDPFWSELKDIAERQRVTLSTMVGDIDTQRRQGNLSSAIRLFVLDQVRNHAPDYAGTVLRPLRMPNAGLALFRRSRQTACLVIPEQQTSVYRQLRGGLFRP
jgi:predicted DNA-binding ribbon-helix-helix protein